MYQYFQAEYFQQSVPNRVFQTEYFKQSISSRDGSAYFQAAKIAHNLVGAVPASEPLGESRHNSAANIHGA